MSEQQTTEPEGFGIKETERRQGFEPMPLAFPDPPKDLADFPVEEETSIGPKEAAEFVAKRRKERQEAAPAEVTPSQNEPLPRAYIHYGGEHSGEPRPANETIELDRAARDISAAREQENILKLAEAERQAIAELDAEAQAAVEQPLPSEAFQPEAPVQEQQPAQVDPLVEELQRSPHLMAALEQQQQQYAAAIEAEKARYIQGLALNAQTALAATVGQFGELRGVTDVNQIPLIVNAVAQSNPQRAQAMTAHLQQVSHLANQAQAAQNQYQQEAAIQYRQQFERAAKVDDENYQRYIDQIEPSPERQREITNTARQILKESGLSDEQIQYEYNSNSLLRSFAGQRLLAEAAIARMNRAGIKQKIANPVPLVQRPGSGSIERHSEVDYNLSKLSNELTRTGSAKAAAALLTARRSGRR